MATRKRVKPSQNLSKQIWQLTKGLMTWLLRNLLIVIRRVRRHTRLSKAGFVLPTVTMVSLVVVLLTTAMMIRSFDRSRSASTLRVNEAVLNAATPALERARTKLDALFADPTLPRGTPSNIALYNAIANNLTQYTFGDEQPLKLVRDIGDGKGGKPNNTIERLANGSASSLENDETLTTAWRFPVDTDNNGRYDSYTLYGIYFRSPTQDNTTGQFNRLRNPLEARTPPMEEAIAGQCAAALGTSASLAGDSGWYKSGNQLKKSFYVYTATVPIISPPAGNEYEARKGSRSFSALEFHQDRTRIPLSNNVAAYEDDLEIGTDSSRLNGRISTNGNFLTGRGDRDIDLYQVSSKDSCYYQAENSKIVVGGNVANGDVTASRDQATANVHLFNGAGKDVAQIKINSTNKSTSNTPREVGYNSYAYAQRIALLVDAQMDYSRNSDPRDVRRAVQAEEDKAASVSEPFEVRRERLDRVRREQLEIYFRSRTRRVPFKEVPYGTDGRGNYTKTNVLQRDNNDPETLRPLDAWMYPTNPSDGKTGTAYTQLNLNLAQLEATEPEEQQKQGIEKYLGDRIQVGNNLPSLWFKDGAFVGAKTIQEILGATWKDSSQTRYRTTHVQPLADLGVTDRDGFWEAAAAAQPTTAVDNKGGLRVVTGAGVYERKNSFLPPPTYDDPTTTAIEKLPTYDDPATTAVEAYPMVWPDLMPMSPGLLVYDNTSATPQWNQLPPTLPNAATPTIDPNTPRYAKGDLRMRATAVYHYTQGAYKPNSPTDYQTPIACVSNYYDPTDSETARNLSPLADVSGQVIGSQPTGAKSNNGIVYRKTTIDANTLSGISFPNSTTGLFNGDENATSIPGKLQYQANLKFPNGRFVNQPLREALKKRAYNQNLTLSEQSAIDSTICALQILDGTINPDPTLIPHGAIKEIAFLDGRQIQAIEDDNPDTNPLETFTTDGNPTRSQGDAILTGNYNLSIEERQPLEIRATVLDMKALRQKTISGGLVQEYLLPNSGIIYASRDDALPDLSDKSVNSANLNTSTRQLLSSTDFKLDPTRRPNGILLTEGSELGREERFREAEKGLILASNLPVYIKGNFNLHSGEEFTNTLDANWGNFYTRSRNQINYNFACRPGDPRLPNCNTGDKWRSATILADAITLLSDNFQFGFRNHGDYDLDNYQGNRNSIAKRKQNGFWRNDFATNGLSSGGLTVGSVTPKDADYTARNSGNAVDSSYFNNFVTPIQRRVNFPEYLMEVCTKLPVSECRPNDWYVNPARDRRASDVLNESFSLTNHPAGTTAQAATPQYQRYARRVAFLRNPYNTIQLTQMDGIVSAVPIGISSDNKIDKFPYDNSSLPRSADNALWFRATNNTIGDPGLEADITYASNKPIYQLPPNQGGNKLILPDVPDIEGVATSLNLPEGDLSGSDYAVCIKNGGISQSYVSNTASLTKFPGNGKCPTATYNAIDQFYRGIEGLKSPLPAGAFPVSGNDMIGGTLTAQQTLNVYELPKNSFANGATIILDSNGIPDAVFVLKASSLKFGDNCPKADNTCKDGIVVTLNGVNPNNVFWAIKGAVQFENVKSEKPHKLVGNLVGKAAIPIIGKNTEITGRILGFSNAEIKENVTITAVTSDGQPLLVPVLQLHSTNGAAGADPNNGGMQVKDTRWMMRAAETTYNLVAAAGDTPTRVNSTVAEGNGGLANFVRFLENWRDETPAKINGSFIQFKRSAYATAPFTSVFSNNQGGIFNYPQAYSTGNGAVGNDWGSLPYYVPPKRQWGFDVALLSQLTDLFSQRFTLLDASEPKEFFRQVSRDDDWVQTLLCAAVNENPKGNSRYEKYAVDDEQRPKCPRPLSDYY